ncbi:MAG: 50S ribosomal protein L28 [Deltaproteobacteria bacterium]|nr:50S ribosomal protein L28 [Deltaproteobacteria bacterium]
MARTCYYCSKKPQTGHKVSHANNKTKRRFLPNLKKVKVLLDGAARSIRLCTRCVRSEFFQKA